MSFATMVWSFGTTFFLTYLFYELRQIWRDRPIIIWDEWEGRWRPARRVRRETR